MLYIGVAYRILCDEILKDSFLASAREMLRIFVAGFSTFYPTASLGYNVHGLLHLADVAQIFGTVDSVSAYKYENAIRHLGGLISKSNQELQQIYNGIQEFNFCNSKIGFQTGRNCCIKNNDRDCYVLLSGSRFGQILKKSGEGGGDEELLLGSSRIPGRCLVSPAILCASA